MQLSAEIVLEKAAEQPRQILRQHRAAPGSVCFASQCHHSDKNAARMMCSLSIQWVWTYLAPATLLHDYNLRLPDYN